MNRVHALLFGAALSLFSPASFAQDAFPNTVVKLVVPFPAGGSTDLLARSLADRLAAQWKQPVIVENRGGASGIIASSFVAKARPDGYTLLLGTVSTHAYAPSLYPSKLTYDVQRSFAPISEVARVPYLLSVNKSLPINSLADFVAYAKARPGQVTFGASPGSTLHMAMELLSVRAKIKLMHIPYKGSSQTMTDMIGGQIQAMMDVVPTAYPFMQAGKIRTLAVTSPTRSPLAPQVPTVAESGYPGFDADAWYGLFAPAGTPPNIVNKISEDVRRALSEPELKQRLEAGGFTVVGSTPSALATRQSDDILRWRKIIKDANIVVE